MSNTPETDSLRISFRNAMKEYYPVALGDTPETDTFSVKFKTVCGEKYWVPVEFAQKLERERNELLKWSHSELSILKGKVAAYKVYHDFYYDKKDK